MSHFLFFFSLPNTKDAIISEILCNLNLGAFLALLWNIVSLSHKSFWINVGPKNEIKSA